LILHIKKNYFYYFYLAYILFGVCLSLTNGISHDEFHENHNWLINFSAIKNILSNGSDEILSNFDAKFHGVAFHFINKPIQ